jgi:hypothetical protein
MPITISAVGPVPRSFKVIRICECLRERHVQGIGDHMRQRRTLARLQKFERREECPSLIGHRV